MARFCPCSPFFPFRRVLLALGFGVGYAALAGGVQAAGLDEGRTWKFTSAFSVRETFDSNVFLQNGTPLATVAGALPPRRASFATAAGATLALERRGAFGFSTAITYAPEATVYHSAASENNVAQRFGLAVAGQAGASTWSVQTNATWIDGSDEGPIFGCAGGAAAIGGIALRDRRDALIDRTAFKLLVPFGAWFVRPVATAYVHDFRTRQSRQPGYLNYIDRREFIAGFDVGREFRPKTRWFAGFRAGRQDQLKLFGVTSPYGSQLRRFLAGIEGAPTPWLQVSLLGGPETHRFRSGTPVGFKRDQVLWWIDGTASLTAGPKNVVGVAVRRFEQPAFASQSVYEDITYEMTWRHKFGDRFSSVLGFKAYGADWPGPATREDWIYSPSVSFRYADSARRTIEFSYAFDSAESRVPATSGREYTRHLVSVATQFSF